MAKLHPFLMEGPTFTMTFVLMARGTKCAILLSLVRHRIKMGRRQAEPDGGIPYFSLKYESFSNVKLRYVTL